MGVVSEINVTRSSMPDFNEYCEEIRDLWESRWLTNMGEKHNKLQAHLEAYLGTDHLELLTNGHVAIELSIQAMGLSGEVITTPFTFASTTQAIVRNGLEPVFCDIDPETFTIDVSKIEPLITENTAAILPVHVYGNVCDVEAIQAIADKFKLKVIYDSAHVFGVQYKDKGIANYGDVNCFSFHATKVFHTIEGGAACFKDKVFVERLRKLRNFGISGTKEIDEIGTNAKMDEFRAVMGICNLRHIEDEISKRKRAVERYRERLSNVLGLQLNPIQKDVKLNYAYFPVIFNEPVFGASRDEILATLNTHKVHARKYFYPLTSELTCYKNRFNSELTPVAKRISKQVLTLPLFAGLELYDVDRICDIILSCKKK